ncbi:DUF6695 family protein [Cognatitamlana onchidii]|uniref:DUF6695 family protein n=1 Tax=Cognatitamlana onchidii TaxID=2562860 RepID=UPI0010A68428|nr:DUF6695 family protein [Algibacter onchidii]
MANTGIVLTLAYPETIVMVSKEWFSPFLRYLGVGKKNYLRAGHAALVLIDKETGVLEYHDFGRYITPEPMGRVRCRSTDNELHFPLKAKFDGETILNLDSILEYLSTHPKITHGEGKLVASVCGCIDYSLAREHINMMQNRHFIRYAAFIKEACNCARFVTDALIASVTEDEVKKKLLASKWFTPSTIGNVLLADTENYIYEVSEDGIISEFKGSQRSENIRCFLDRLTGHVPSFTGTLEPRPLKEISENAQWLSGIAAGAWFEVFPTKTETQFKCRRISPYGNVDIDALFEIDKQGFDYTLEYLVIHYSNCKFFTIQQNKRVYTLSRLL